MAYPAGIQSFTVPLSQDPELSGDGRIECMSMTSFEDLQKLTGFFAFTFYFPNMYFLKEDSQENKQKITKIRRNAQKYINGFYAYLSILHNRNIEATADGMIPGQPASNPFESWGMLVYTNTQSIPEILRIFPLEVWPKLVLCITHWPRYEVIPGESGNVEPTVMRLLRYHAMELFPDKYICIRDIDSYFPDIIETGFDESVLQSPEFKVNKGGNENLYSNPLNTELGRIQSWESNFVNTWISKGYPIVMGTHNLYVADWHSNLPISVGYKQIWLDTLRSSPYSYIDPSILYKSKIDAQDVFKVKAPFGLYAGFINISPAFSPEKRTYLWKANILFLYKRYFITTIRDEITISNRNGVFVTGSAIGKDERVLLFEWCRLFLPEIHFFYIFFVRGATEIYKKMELFPVEPVKVYGKDKYEWRWYNPLFPILALEELCKAKDLKDYFENFYKKSKLSRNRTLSTRSKRQQIRQGYLEFTEFLDDPNLNKEGVVHFRFSDYLKKILEVLLEDYEKFRESYDEREKLDAMAKIIIPNYTHNNIGTFYIQRTAPPTQNLMNRKLGKDAVNVFDAAPSAASRASGASGASGAFEIAGASAAAEASGAENSSSVLLKAEGGGRRRKTYKKKSRKSRKSKSKRR